MKRFRIFCWRVYCVNDLIKSRLINLFLFFNSKDIRNLAWFKRISQLHRKCPRIWLRSWLPIWWIQMRHVVFHHHPVYPKLTFGREMMWSIWLGMTIGNAQNCFYFWLNLLFALWTGMRTRWPQKYCHFTRNTLASVSNCPKLIWWPCPISVFRPWKIGDW